MVKIKHYLEEIETINKALGDDPSFEKISEALKRRDLLICKMKEIESELEKYDSEWRNNIAKQSNTKILLEESNKLLKSITTIDNKLALLLENKMKEINEKLKSIYESSRVAQAYTANSNI
jgi:seryl-tRNA synthetase